MSAQACSAFRDAAALPELDIGGKALRYRRAHHCLGGAVGVGYFVWNPELDTTANNLGIPEFFAISSENLH